MPKLPPKKPGPGSKKKSKKSSGKGAKKKNDNPLPQSGQGRPNPNLFIPAPDRPMYDRQPEETDSAFEAFRMYRDQTPPRSGGVVQEKLGHTARDTVEKWSSRWHWRARAAEWDREQDRIRRKEVLEAEAKKVKGQIATADSMWQLAAKSLEITHRQIDLILKRSRAGESVGSPISPKDTKALAEAGIKLARLIADLPTDIEERRVELSTEDRRKAIASLVQDKDVRRAMSLVARRAAAAKTVDDEMQ